MGTPIKLRAEDDEDLKVVSACLQDAVVPIGEMCFLPRERCFVLLVSRFKWETADGAVAERVHCAVRFDNVATAKTRGIDLKDRRQILELLSLEAMGQGVALHFAGGGCIRLDGDPWRCTVEDVGEPWPASCTPCHPLAEDDGGN